MHLEIIYNLLKYEGLAKFVLVPNCNSLCPFHHLLMHFSDTLALLPYVLEPLTPMYMYPIAPFVPLQPPLHSLNSLCLLHSPASHESSVPLHPMNPLSGGSMGEGCQGCVPPLGVQILSFSCSFQPKKIG